MGANTEMSRLDSIPTEKLNDILGLDTDTLGEIPAPDAEDNGKVLGVSNGAYALVNGGGGGGAEPLIVTITVENEVGTTTYTCDKTWKQIYDAFSAGTPVVGLLHYTVYDSEMDVTSESWESNVCNQASKYAETGSGGTTSAYSVIFNSTTYESESENGYPHFSMVG